MYKQEEKIIIRISKEMKNNFKKICEENSINMSTQIKILLKDFIKKEKNG